MMFGAMFDVFAWGIFLSLVSMALAFLAEGRGAQTIRVLLGVKEHKEHIDLYATLHREEGDWQILGPLAEIEEASADRAGLNPVEANSYRRPVEVSRHLRPIEAAHR